MSFKKEVRIIAWDDCAFSFNAKSVRIVGAVFRGGEFLDGVLSAKIKKDGTDITEKIINSIKKSRHHDQLSIIMLNGITFAGFNIADIKKLSKATRMPVIAVMRNKPDMKKFMSAMRRVDNYSKRTKLVKSAGRIYTHKNIFFQKSGITTEECDEILKKTCVRSKIPEPIRVAHLIASGLSRKHENGYESRGGA
ncbi:DUF99 family protein [archaeon]|nr:DUF99 family protein [archaeon]